MSQYCDRFATFFGSEATLVKYQTNKKFATYLYRRVASWAYNTKRTNVNSRIAKRRWKKVCESRLKHKFTAIIARLSAGFAVLSAHTMCAGVNEHRYACISIKGKYDERKTGHVAAVFRTCCAHNASDRSLSMWRRKRRPRNAIISLLISSRSIHNFSLCILMTLRIIARDSPPEMCSAKCFIFADWKKDLSDDFDVLSSGPCIKEDWVSSKN